MTLEVAERCNVDMELGRLLLPRFPTLDGEDPAAMLRRLATEGLARRYGDPPPAEAVERLEFELGVIGEMGFDSYFLIVWDFVNFAKGQGIAVGPGRGSAAGSIVAYALNITDLDPIENDLLFERFLNPARKSMPDIDIDFSVRGRERVIRYVADKYGRESVAQIITFGKMAPRAATRDAARVLGFDYATGDRLAKLIPEPIMGRSPSFEDCLKPGEELRHAVESDPNASKIVDIAKGLEGKVRNNSIHAAAVVIADRPLDEIVPLQLAEDRSGAGGNGNGKVNGRAERSYKIVTQYSMGPIEEIGLLKMDFLGLRNLDVIEDAVDIIQRSRGTEIDMEEIPLDDAKTYEMLSRGDSVGVFQMESDGMSEALKQIRPTGSTTSRRSTPSIARERCATSPTMRAASAIPRRSRYPDDRLRPITEETYGCCHLPGAADGDLEADRRLLAGRSGRPAQGGWQEEARPDGDDEGQVPRGLQGFGHAAQGRRRPLVADDRGGRLLVQQVARRLLRADLLPHRLSEGELPGRVHGCGDLLGDVDQGQGSVLRQPLRGDGHRGAAARRELLRPRLRRLRQVHPLRPRRGQERRPRGGRGDPRALASVAARSSRSGTSASAWTRGR